MKALSVREPWITLIAAGWKTIETRTWSTRYRGELLLCGSASPRGPRAGLAACVAKLVDCRPLTDSKEDSVGSLTDLYAGAMAWVFEDIRPVMPFPVRGKLGVFDLPLEGAYNLHPLPLDDAGRGVLQMFARRAFRQVFGHSIVTVPRADSQ